MSVLVSSLLSTGAPNGLVGDERPKRANERDNRLGESGLEMEPASVLLRVESAGGVEVRIGKVVEDSTESCLIGDLVFRTSMPGARASFG